ncbi:MAG: glycosyltransferase [Agathobacter sp.]|nr:glycosyltransferase [Agathobacter sp.]
MEIQSPILTISLLISNRPDTIRRCLNSLRPLIEAVPCELILTDTSKNPEINAICYEYTDQVYEFDWCHDFAKARNFGLEKAKGEWFFFLDDDEWLVDVEELIEFFCSGEYQEYGRATYLVRNFYDPDYVQYADCWVSRMNRIDTDSHFVGRVHEYMEPCRGKEKHIHAIAYHSGYVFSTEEERSKHAKRNIVLLLEALNEEPDNIRWQTQLAQEYRSAMDWEQLVSYCKECITKDMSNESKLAVHFPEDDLVRLQIGTFYAGLAEGLCHLEQYQEVIVCCEETLADQQVNPLLKAHAYICMAEAYFGLSDWKKACEYARAYLREEEILNVNDTEGRSPLSHEQKMVIIVQHTFDPSNLKKAYSILICEDLKKGSTKALHEFYDKLEWNETVNYVFERLPNCLIESMPNLPYEPIFSQIVTDTFKREDFKIFMCREVLKCNQMVQDQTSTPKAFEKLAYIFAQAESDFWFIWYMKVWDAFYRGDVAALEVYTQDAWESNVRSFIYQGTKQQIDSLYVNLQKLKENCGLKAWKLVCFENIVIEKQVMDGPKDLGNLQSYFDVLVDYAQMSFMLDSTAKAVEKIRMYIELEKQDKLEAMKQLKKAVDICPDFAEGIGRFLGHYGDLEKQRVGKQQVEMKKLRGQVLEQVREMMANGQEQAALQILGQLKKMFPNDLDVATIALEIQLSDRGYSYE